MANNFCVTQNLCAVNIMYTVCYENHAIHHILLTSPWGEVSKDQ